MKVNDAAIAAVMDSARDMAEFIQAKGLAEMYARHQWTVHITEHQDPDHKEWDNLEEERQVDMVQTVFHGMEMVTRAVTAFHEVIVLDSANPFMHMPVEFVQPTTFPDEHL